MDEKLKNYTDSAVSDVDMTNALLGRVFDVLTSGGTVGMESDDNFYCWLSVGHPVQPDQFEFLEQGLTGTLRKRTIGDMNDKTGESDTTSSPLLKMIRKNQEELMNEEMTVNTAETKDEPLVKPVEMGDAPAAYIDKLLAEAERKKKEEAEKKAKEEAEKDKKDKKDEADNEQLDKAVENAEKATSKANTAADNANTAADNANKAASAANTAAGSVSDATAEAGKAATAAYAAAETATTAAANLDKKVESAVSEAMKNAQPSTEKMTQEEMNQILGEDTVRMYMQAEDLARLVDFIPDFTPKDVNDPLKRIQIRYDEGSLSDVYKHALRYSQVMKSESSEEDKAKIAELRALLQVETTVPGIKALGEEDKIVIEDSPLVQAYNTQMLAYNAAALQYNNKKIAALTAKDPAAVHDWAMNAPIYENSKNAAMAAWKTKGYKEQYEKITAAISQMEQRDFMLAKEECWKALERSLCTGISSGSDFYFTTLSPASFMRSGGWTRISFNQTDYTSENIEKTKNHGLHADTNAKVSGIFTGIEAKYSHDEADHRQSLDASFDLSNFEISFDVCQVNIVRPWFKPTFLNSQYWRFDQGNVITKDQVLSDGKSKGLLPAYPTSIVFIRNVEIDFGSETNTKNFLHTFKEKQDGGGMQASTNFLFVNASAGFNVASTDQNTEDKVDIETHIKGNKLTIPGTQIIGYCCHRLGICPNPHSEITEWV